MSLDPSWMNPERDYPLVVPAEPTLWSVCSGHSTKVHTTTNYEHHQTEFRFFVATQKIHSWQNQSPVIRFKNGVPYDVWKPETVSSLMFRVHEAVKDALSTREPEAVTFDLHRLYLAAVRQDVEGFLTALREL